MAGQAAAESAPNQAAAKVLEFVRTIEGEVIPRGPIGKRSVFTTPKGRIINLDLEGLPVQLGPKSEVIRINQAASNYRGGIGGNAISEINKKIQAKEESGYYEQNLTH